MQKITRKYFMNELIENKSTLLIGQFLNKSKDETKAIIENWLRREGAASCETEIRQGYKHSNGLKFQLNDGTFSYVSLGGGHEYYQDNDILITLKEHDNSTSIVIYQVIKEAA